MKLLIKNATIHDPRNGIDGKTGDLYVQGEHLVASFRDPDRVIDAKGAFALPGAIEAGGIFTPYGFSLYAHQASS